MAGDATLYPRYDDLMRVVVTAAKRRFRRNHLRGLFEARLTREQLLADLRQAHDYYAAPSRGSVRSVTRWLDAMERLRFFRRRIEVRRDGLGRIVWTVLVFSFGLVGIQWIKRQAPEALIGLGRTVLPKMAFRFETSSKNLKQGASVHGLSTEASPPRERGGMTTAPKSVALRIRLRSSARTAAAQPTVKGARQKRITARQERAHAIERARAERQVKARQRRSKRAVARRRAPGAPRAKTTRKPTRNHPRTYRKPPRA